MKYIFLMATAFLIVPGCASNDNSDQKTGLLCMVKMVDGEEVSDCLDHLSADAAEVNRRVALYNQDVSEEQQISCKKRQSVGSRFNYWKCYDAKKNPLEDTNTQRDFQKIIRKGSF